MSQEPLRKSGVELTDVVPGYSGDDPSSMQSRLGGLESTVGRLVEQVEELQQRVLRDHQPRMRRRSSRHGRVRSSSRASALSSAVLDQEEVMPPSDWDLWEGEPSTGGKKEPLAAKKEASLRWGAEVKKVDEVREEEGGEGEVEIHSPADIGNSLRTDFYMVEENIWGAAMLIGLKGVGQMDTTVVLSLLGVNVLGVTIFLLTLGTAPSFFLQNEPPETLDMVRWRTTEGQAVQNVFAGWSLSQRVCSQDDALSVAAEQLDVVTVSEAYTHRPSFLPFEIGPALATFVLLIWFLVVSVELTQCLDHVTALLTIPRQSKTRLTRRGDAMYLRSITTKRCVMLVAFAAIRTILALWMLAFGCMWLSKTTDLENLLLNASALAFVFDMDELLLKAFGPHTISVIMEELDSLPMPRVGRTLGLRPRTIPLCLLALVTLGLCGGVLVPATVLNMIELNETLCGGYTDFAAGVHPTLGYLQAATTSDSFDLLTEMQIEEVSKYANRKLRNGTGGATIRVQPDLRSLVYAQNAQVESLVAAHACGNIQDLQVMDVIGIVIGDPLLKSCADLDRKFCAVQDLQIVRAACPATCGCNSVLTSPPVRSGCPPSCILGSAYQVAVRQMPCEDLNENAMIQASPSMAAILKQNFNHLDCSKVKPRMCLPFSEMVQGSFLYFCPQACGCQGLTGHSECPPSCR